MMIHLLVPRLLEAGSRWVRSYYLAVRVHVLQQHYIMRAQNAHSH